VLVIRARTQQQRADDQEDKMVMVRTAPPMTCHGRFYFTRDFANGLQRIADVK